MMRAAVGELELIQRIRAAAKTRNAAVRVGIGDDCAVVKVVAGQEMVVTTDFCLEGRHFRRDWHSPESAGHRCLARGLSDVAAMGARPVAAFQSLALPRGFDERWFDGFMRGFEGLAAEYAVELAGGDTAEAPGKEILADVVVLGMVPKGQVMRRVGARVGDGIYVSGTLGGSAAELACLAKTSEWKYEARPQTFPEPRVTLGMQLTKRGLATACMDLSDGLSTDLGHLCKASGVRAVVDLSKIPVGEGATLEQALHGGEDYELLLTVMAGVPMPRAVAGVPLTRIGTIVGGEGVLVELVGGGELKPQGWEHFRGQVWG
jgi:thiamine-monophosphate kinase